MPLSSTRWGNDTADALATWSSANVPPTRLTFITGDELREVWRIIEGVAVPEIATNATITMESGDFKVLPGTFEENNPIVAPITGEGENKAFELTGKIS